MDSIFQDLLAVTGTIVTLAVSITVIVLGRLIIRKSIRDARNYPLHRQLFTLGVSILGLFIAAALLPLPAEVRAQVLSILGILLSVIIALSSTTLVGNAMAGIMLRLMHGFHAGDFIQFESLNGRITDFAIFHTEVQLITRDIVMIPNLQLVQKAVQVTRRGGTFIHAAVSIGYDEPHGKVEEALKKAVESCSLAEPFVFIEELGNYAVRYRVYGLLEESNERLSRTSQLKKAILNTLHNEQIEIMSPQIVDRREYPGDHKYVPPVQKPKKTENESIEEIAFDRAEEAESIEQLYAVREKISGQLSLVKDSSKAEKEKSTNNEKKADASSALLHKRSVSDKQQAPTDMVKKETDQRERMQEQLSRIDKEIEKREKAKEQQRLKESTDS
ncbi:MAG: mechanosensitive ion channel [Spirochaetales bacterium]|nr:mechanosensitive ion channel [Spirochaetales bacterium]